MDVTPSALETPMAITPSMILGGLALLVSALWGLVMFLGRQNFAMRMDLISKEQGSTALGLSQEKTARESDIRELRSEVRALGTKLQEGREEKIKLEGAVTVIQGTLNQQADALDNQTRTIMARLEQLDYRKQSRGEMLASQRDLRAEPTPYAPGPMRPRVPTGQDFER